MLQARIASPSKFKLRNSPPPFQINDYDAGLDDCRTPQGLLSAFSMSGVGE